MFDLSLVDHLRLTFGHVIYRQRAHARAAHVYARAGRILRVSEAVLIASAAVSSFGAAFGRGPAWAVAAAVFASLALLVLLVSLLFDYNASAEVHRVCSARLWRIREQYRALLSDLHDGAIDLNTARHWRDGLMKDVHAIYESAPPADRQMYEASRKVGAAGDDAVLSDEEIDRFLPPSLQKGKPAAA
jgi:hypothetical protein